MEPNALRAAATPQQGAHLRHQPRRWSSEGKGMNDFIRRERHLAEADPAEAIRLGLLSGGEHAHAFVRRSEKDVAGWLDGAGKY